MTSWAIRIAAKRYDETGQADTQPGPTREQQRLQNLAQILIGVAQNISDPASINFVAELKEALAGSRQHFNAEKKKHERKAEKFRATAKRTKRADGGENFIATTLEHAALTEDQAIQKIDEVMFDIDEIIKMMVPYRYEFDASKRQDPDQLTSLFIDEFSRMRMRW